MASLAAVTRDRAAPVRVLCASRTFDRSRTGEQACSKRVEEYGQFCPTCANYYARHYVRVPWLLVVPSECTDEPVKRWHSDPDAYPYSGSYELTMAESMAIIFPVSDFHVRYWYENVPEARLLFPQAGESFRLALHNGRLRVSKELASALRAAYAADAPLQEALGAITRFATDARVTGFDSSDPGTFAGIRDAALELVNNNDLVWVRQRAKWRTRVAEAFRKRLDALDAAQKQADLRAQRTAARLFSKFVVVYRRVAAAGLPSDERATVLDNAVAMAHVCSDVMVILLSLLNSADNAAGCLILAVGAAEMYDAVSDTDSRDRWRYIALARADQMPEEQRSESNWARTINNIQCTLVAQCEEHDQRVKKVMQALVDTISAAKVARASDRTLFLSDTRVALARVCAANAAYALMQFAERFGELGMARDVAREGAQFIEPETAQAAVVEYLHGRLLLKKGERDEALGRIRHAAEIFEAPGTEDDKYAKLCRQLLKTGATIADGPQPTDDAMRNERASAPVD